MEDITLNNPETPTDLKGKRELLAAYRDALTSDEHILEYHLQQWIVEERARAYMNLTARFRKLAQKGAARFKVDMARYPAPSDDDIAVLREYFDKRAAILEQEIADLEGKPVSFTTETAAPAAPQV